MVSANGRLGGPSCTVLPRLRATGSSATSGPRGGVRRVGPERSHLAAAVAVQGDVVGQQGLETAARPRKEALTVVVAAA